MVSSHMPKVVPATEKMVIVAGMKNFCMCGLWLKYQAIQFTPAVIAPVFWMMVKMPPMMKQKPMILAAAMKPSSGAISTAPIPCGWLSTRLKESAITRVLPSTSWR